MLSIDPVRPWSFSPLVRNPWCTAAFASRMWINWPTPLVTPWSFACSCDSCEFRCRNLAEATTATTATTATVDHSWRPWRPWILLPGGSCDVRPAWEILGDNSSTRRRGAEEHCSEGWPCARDRAARGGPGIRDSSNIDHLRCLKGTIGTVTCQDMPRLWRRKETRHGCEGFFHIAQHEPLKELDPEKRGLQAWQRSRAATCCNEVH